MLLANNRIYLRAVEPEDLEYLYKWENDTSLWIHGNTLAPYSKNTIKQYIEEAQQYDIFQSNQLRLMICRQEDNLALGAVDLYEVEGHHSRTGLGIFVEHEYREQGYAKEALNLVAEYCFSFLNLHQIFVYISTENTISIDLFSQAGYQKIGVLKDWIYTINRYEDVVLMQLVDNGNS